MHAEVKEVGRLLLFNAQHVLELVAIGTSHQRVQTWAEGLAQARPAVAARRGEIMHNQILQPEDRHRADWEAAGSVPVARKLSHFACEQAGAQPRLGAWGKRG